MRYDVLELSLHKISVAFNTFRMDFVLNETTGLRQAMNHLLNAFRLFPANLATNLMDITSHFFRSARYLTLCCTCLFVTLQEP